MPDESNNIMISPQFDIAFLTWFRDQTEATWRGYETMTLQDYVARGVGGADWQRGTRWLAGLSEQEIREIEQHWQLDFPPDYRLFLKTLHSIDKPLSGARYMNTGQLVEHSRPSFLNWQTENVSIEQAYEDAIEGILFDVQHSNAWLSGWGKKPVTHEAQEAHIRALVAVAPRLVPILGHRFLLAEPCQSGNPVFSLHQTDIIIYAPNLYYHFLSEFAYLLALSQEEKQAIEREKRRITNAQFANYTAIPFWGEFL